MPNGDDPNTSMSDEERLIAISGLLRLRRRGDQPAHLWLNNIRSVFERSDELTSLLEFVPKPKETDRVNGSAVLAILDDALHRLEAKLEPSSIVASLRLAAKNAADEAATLAAGEAVRRATDQAAERSVKSLVDSAANDAIWNSAPVRMAKWLLPLLAAAVFGGTVYGVIQTKGLVDIAEQSRNAITTARDDALKGIEADLKKEVTAQHEKIDALFEEATRGIQTDRDHRRQDIERVSQAAEIELKGAGSTAQADLKSHAQTAWSDVEKNGITVLGARRDAVLAAFDSKLAEANNRSQEIQVKFDGMLGELPKRLLI